MDMHVVLGAYLSGHAPEYNLSPEGKNTTAQTATSHDGMFCEIEISDKHIAVWSIAVSAFFLVLSTGTRQITSSQFWYADAQICDH